MFTPKTFMSQHFKALVITATICLLGTSLAAQNLHGVSTGASNGGAAITNTASMTYTLGTGGASIVTPSNTVTAYVNQIDAFYMTVNDTSLNGTTVRVGNDVLTGASVGVVAVNNSIVNLSNGPITLTMGISAKGTLTAPLTPYVAGATWQSTVGYYSFTATGSGVATSGSTVGSTITIQQGATAILTVTVTSPVADLFVTTLTDSTTALLVNAGNAANFTVTNYSLAGNPTLWATYSGLDTQVTSEVDIAAKANFGKLQLLDSTCGGTAFATTSITGGVRNAPVTASFPASFAWVAGQPIAGTVGLAAVSANVGECIVYQIILNNPLTLGSIPIGAAISDTLNSNVTFVAGKTVVTAGFGTPGTTSPSLTTTAAIGVNGTVVLQYEAKVN